MKIPGVKTEISSRNSIFLLFVIILSVTVRDGAVTAGRDLWISSIIAVAIIFPVILLFCRISYLCGGNDIFTFIEMIFGKKASKIIIGLFAWYALQVSALVISSYTEFTHIVEVDKTSKLVLAATLALVAAFLAQSGLRTLGRWSVIIGILVIVNILVTLIISIPVMDVSYLLPVLDNTAGDVLSQGVVYSFAIYGETVIFLVAVTAVKKGKSRVKAYISGTLFGALFLTVTVLKNIMVIGPLLMEESYYPSYTAARIIRLDGFFERIESLISLNFILMGITKLALCLTSAARGISRLTSNGDHRKYTWITALCAAALGYTQFSGIPELMKFVKHYWIYAIPFQIILPLIIWIIAEIRLKKNFNTPACTSASNEL